MVLAACSRQELLRHISTVVHDVAPRWGDEESVTILITSSVLDCADVEAAFDEIDEVCHIDGIDLRVHRQQGECLRAVLEQSSR